VADSTLLSRWVWEDGQILPSAIRCSLKVLNTNNFILLLILGLLSRVCKIFYVCMTLLVFSYCPRFRGELLYVLPIKVRAQAHTQKGIGTHGSKPPLIHPRFLEGLRHKLPIVIMENFNLEPCDCLKVMLYNEINN
jgi:hypothetical protein